MPLAKSKAGRHSKQSPVFSSIELQSNAVHLSDPGSLIKLGMHLVQRMLMLVKLTVSQL